MGGQPRRIAETAPGGRWGRRSSPALATVLLLLAVGAAACGQYGGVHSADQPASRTRAQRGRLPATGTILSASANGENIGLCTSPSPLPGATAPASPPPGCTIIGYVAIVTIKHVRRARSASHPATVDVRGRRSSDPFLICPVHGTGYYSDDFGAPRYSGSFHLHAGNDIFAPLGTPIVAPFDGHAVASPNGLGGLAVTVYGPHGYVYNAHLIRYGTLGTVKAGTVIGFVGNTGDAAGGPTHDHFEWHPKPLPPSPLHVSPYGASIVGRQTDPAIDPFPFLNGVCR